jgi:hypothetical protein
MYPVWTNEDGATCSFTSSYSFTYSADVLDLSYSCACPYFESRARSPALPRGARLLPMVSLLRLRRIDALRGAIAGSAATSMRRAAVVLFEAGGRRLLPATVQHAVRSTVEREAARVLVGVGVLEQGAATATRLLDRGAVRTVAVHGTRAAGRQIARSMSAAAGMGALVDGGWALVQSMKRVRSGAMTQKDAALHVAREASTGAAATVAGTAAAVLLVTLTGGIATPALFFVGAAASAGAKIGLDAWLDARAAGAIRAELASPVSPAS